MDDQQLMSALSGDSLQVENPADSGMITDAADVEEILESGASLSLDESPDEDGVIGEAGGRVPMEHNDDLDQIRQQRDYAMGILQQQQQQAQQRQAYEYWEGSRQQAEAAFAAQEREIFKEAENAYDSTAFIKEKMGNLNNQREQWRTQYHAARESALRQQTERMAIPGYANEVASHFGLSQENVNELLQFPPQMMPQVAAIMARSQSQTSRSRTAKNMSQRMLAPGNGRSSGKIKAGSDAHLYALLRGVAE